MDNNTITQEHFQKVIDETNKVLSVWRHSKHIEASPTHQEVQSLFLSKLKKFVYVDYIQYSKMMRHGKPTCYISKWKIATIYSSNEYATSMFSKCDYKKDVPNYEPVLESVNSINFYSITSIKFD